MSLQTLTVTHYVPPTALQQEGAPAHPLPSYPSRLHPCTKIRTIVRAL